MNPIATNGTADEDLPEAWLQRLREWDAAWAAKYESMRRNPWTSGILTVAVS
jgi:hypothetical protein